MEEVFDTSIKSLVALLFPEGLSLPSAVRFIVSTLIGGLLEQVAQRLIGMILPAALPAAPLVLQFLLAVAIAMILLALIGLIWPRPKQHHPIPAAIPPVLHESQSVVREPYGGASWSVDVSKEKVDGPFCIRDGTPLWLKNAIIGSMWDIVRDSDEVNLFTHLWCPTCRTMAWIGGTMFPGRKVGRIKRDLLASVKHRQLPSMQDAR